MCFVMDMAFSNLPLSRILYKLVHISGLQIQLSSFISVLLCQEVVNDSLAVRSNVHLNRSCNSLKCRETASGKSEIKCMWWMYNKKWKTSYSSCYPCSTLQTPKAASELMSHGLVEVAQMSSDILEMPPLHCPVPGFCQMCAVSGLLFVII